MKSAVTISQAPEARGGPFVFCGELASGFGQAAEFGFDAVEIFPHSATDLDQFSLSELCVQHDLKVAAVGTGSGWLVNKWHLCHPDADVRRKAADFIGEIIDAAAKLGAPAIVGSMQGRAEGGVSRDQALEWLRDALLELGDRAAGQGQILIYEPLNRYETNVFNRIAEAAEFLDAADIGTVKLLADLFHMNIEEVSIPQALRAAGRRIGHIHFADSNRQAVGFGHTDAEPVVEALDEIEYEGYLSAEILPLPDPRTAAAQAATAFSRHVCAPSSRHA